MILVFSTCGKSDNFISIDYDCYKGELNNPCKYQSIWNFEELSPILKASTKEVLLKTMDYKEFENDIEFIEMRIYENCSELSNRAMKYIKYNIYFKRKFKDKAVSSYCFKLLLNSEGEYQGSWNLPDFNRDSKNKKIISKTRLDSILDANKFRNYTDISLDFDGLNHNYELLFRKKKDESKPLGSFNTSYAKINVHTGEFNSREEWEKKTATNVNLLPKFGYIEKTLLQQEMDKAYIDEILEKDSLTGNKSEKLIQLGTKSLREDQDRKKAMYLYNLAYLEDSTNIDIYWGYGNVYMSLGRWEKAVEQYEIGLDIDSTNANLLKGYAHWSWLQYNSLKDMEEQEYREGAESRLNTAIFYLTQAHKYNPEDNNINLSLSSFYLDKGDCNNALKYYDKCKLKTEDSYKQKIKSKLEKNCIS